MFNFRIATLVLLLSVASRLISAQSTLFTYQGKLTDGGGAANVQYDFIFRLFDASGTQIGGDLSKDDVQVTGGIFTVVLDFGTSPFVSNSADSLEIAVRLGSSSGSYVTLTPRQPLTSSPYALKSLNTTSADSLSGACLECITDSHIQSIDGGKVTGSVPNATTASIAGNISGVVGISNGGTGSTTKNFVDLSTDQSVNGNKTFAGSVSVAGGTGVFIGNGSGLTNLTGANIAGGTVTTTQLSADALPNSHSLTLLGSLRWDVLKGQASFATGTNPVSAAFDGANIWVANLNSFNVTKIRASDGTILGSFPISGGGNPNSIAFDGASIWVSTNGNGSNLFRLRASDGANLGTFSFAGGTGGVTFDGSNIWVTNGSNVVKLRASDAAVLGTFPAGTNPLKIVFDGANIWVVNLSSNNVTKLRASDGTNQGTFPVGISPQGIAFDGANIWVGNFSSNNVTKLRASDGANLGTFSVGTNPIALGFDGESIWVANFGSNNVTTLRSSDGATLGSFPTGTQPEGFAFDGANMWVTIRGNNQVTRMAPSFPQ